MAGPAPTSALPAIATSFVRKLYRILDQESTAVIAWDADGASFVVLDGEALDAHVLPRYFRGRLDNFRQQLREHSFSAEPAAQGQERYQHRFFRRGCPDQLNLITHSPLPRKRPPRKKKRKQEHVPIAATTDNKIVKSSDTRDVHRATSLVVQQEFKHAVIDDPAALAANPLFAADDSSLSGLVHGLAEDTLAAAPVMSTTGLTSGKEETMSEDVMEALLSLLSTSLSTDGRETTGNGATPATAAVKPTCSVVSTTSTSSTDSHDLFAEGRPPVVLPPVPPGIVENGQFSDDTINNLMRWLSADGRTSASS